MEKELEGYDNQLSVGTKKTGQERLKLISLGFCQDSDAIKKDREPGMREKKS